jgi:hypothetical protein
MTDAELSHTWVDGRRPRRQRARGRALRALRPSRRFAPSSRFLLGPEPLVAMLRMQWLFQARFGDPSGSWTAVTS